MRLRSQFGAAIAWSAAGSWSRQTFLLVVYILLASRLGPQAYGLFGMIAVVLALGYTILVDASAVFVVRAPNVDPGHLDTIFWLQAAIAAALATAMIVGGGPLAAFYREPTVAPLLRDAAVLPPLYALSSVPNALLQRQLRFRSLAMRGFVAACAGGAAGLALAARGWGPFSLLAMAVVQQPVQALCLWPAARWRPGLAMRRQHLADVLAFTRHAVAVNLLIFIDQQAPRVAVGAFLGAEALGFFTMGWRLVETVSILTTMSVSQAAIPIISRDVGRGNDAARADQTLLLSCAVGLPCLAGLFVTAPVLISALFGSRWEAAVPAVRAAAAMGLTWPPIFALDAAMVAWGQMRARTYITVLRTALLAPILWAALPYGAGAVLAGMAFRDTIAMGAYFAALGRYRQRPSSHTIGRLARIAGVAVAMALAVVVWLRLLSPWVGPRPLLASAVVVGAAIYAAGLLLLRVTKIPRPALGV
jgi:O-antigen/teichoic acid export membrane protein